MDPKTINAAKAIPTQFKNLVSALFDESKGPLRQGVGALRGSLRQVEKYLEQIERENLSGSKAEGSSTKKATKKTTRKGKRFPIADFILAQLKGNPAGMRPRDIAAAVRDKAPGKHKDATAVVNSTLARLRTQGKVVNKGGVWTLASGSSKTSTGATKKKATKKAKKKVTKKKARKASKRGAKK